MNWDAIGAVGEIVGAVAIVVTLLYLASDSPEHEGDKGGNILLHRWCFGENSVIRDFADLESF